MWILTLTQLRRTLMCAALLAPLWTFAQPGDRQCPPRCEPGVPTWFAEHLESRMAEGGRWIANNDAYLNDSEPIDAYGIEWQWGAGKKSLRGRMFAIAAGRETATVWELRTLWHPGERRAQVFQYGSDGTFIEGVLEPDGAGGIRLEQTVHSPDGGSSLVRHVERVEADGACVSSASHEGPSGWVTGRTYVWMPRAE